MYVTYSMYHKSKFSWIQFPYRTDQSKSQFMLQKLKLMSVMRTGSTNTPKKCEKIQIIRYSVYR